MVYEPTTTLEQPTGEAGEPKTDLDRRGQLVARLASILYLEKLKQDSRGGGGGRAGDQGEGEARAAEPEKSDGERERRQCLKTLLSHVLDDNYDDRDGGLRGPKGVAFSADAKRLLQTFFLEAAGILTEQAEGLALEAWQSRHPQQHSESTSAPRPPSHQPQREHPPHTIDVQSSERHDTLPQALVGVSEGLDTAEHHLQQENADNTENARKAEETTDGEEGSSLSSAYSMAASSTSPLSTSPVCMSLSSCSSFSSDSFTLSTPRTPTPLSRSSSFVPVVTPPSSATPEAGPRDMYTSAPVYTQRTQPRSARSALIGITPDRPSISWHHVVKAVELLLQLPLGDTEEAVAASAPEGGNSAMTVHVRREKARSLSALGRNNMEDPLLRHYSFFRLIDQNVPVFLRLLESEQGWDLVTKQHGVVIHRRVSSPTPQGRNIHCFRGVGVIRAPPAVVKEYLFEQKDWALWDCYAKDYKEVERLDSCTKITHFRYETERCFVQHRRDFCALLHLIRRPRGAILLFGQSVDHPMCPRLEGWTRGIALHSGALIEPKKDREGNLVSKVTIITQIDLLGLPAAIVNYVQVQRPLLIAHIQRRLDAEH